MLEGRKRRRRGRYGGEGRMFSGKKMKWKIFRVEKNTKIIFELK